MPNATRNPGSAPSEKGPQLPFEEALHNLESIVESMESEELPLEALLAKYQEGTRLARICQEKLAEAEQRIQQLEKQTSGEFKLKPLSPEESEAD